MAEQKEVITFIQQQWGTLDRFCETNFSQSVWDKLSERAFEDLKFHYKHSFSLPFCIRLVGQSGSGKTSQLLPAIKEALKAQSQAYIHLAVRDFVVYHPYLTEIKACYGEGSLREKTNAFALILLTLVFEKCVHNKYAILLEMTLLTPEYERLIHMFLQQQNYSCDYQCLAIEPAISNTWIEARQRMTQRIVSKRSSDFFLQTLQPAFKELQAMTIRNRVFIWDNYHIEPQMTNLSDMKLWQKILSVRNLSLPPLDFDTALISKVTFLKNFYATHTFYV